MRALLILLAVLISEAWLIAQTPDPPYVEYQIRICTMIGNKVIQDAHGHLERLNGGEVHYEFRLDAQGRVSNLRIQSTLRDRWAEQDVARVIHALKFPPVPAQVFRDFHSNQTSTNQWICRSVLMLKGLTMRWSEPPPAARSHLR